MDSNRILEIFKEITRIPRESGHEELMTAWLLKWAEDRKLECRRDETGNVYIARPAAPGKENVPTLVLQAHQDMVCEKNEGVQHDFNTDPINYVIEDGWMIAKDTTLGADDGIGIAACLAALEGDLDCGRLECIFTISEETGMDGAEAMKEGFFSGKTLINLDSEDEGEMFIGCAGGMHTEAEFSFAQVDAPAGDTVSIKIGGGVGGHSGDDINKERVNTVQQMARFLYTQKDIKLVSINGGGKHNAIARECVAVAVVPSAAVIENALKAFGADLQAEYRLSDPELTFTVSVLPAAQKCFEDGFAATLVRALLACPHGVYAMSQDIKGLVETSTNLASIRTNAETGKIAICTSQRSSISSACTAMADKVAACFELAGAKVAHNLPYPGWKPNVDSNILKVCVESYKRIFGVEPAVKAIHAGLECGLFLNKFPGLDMISFGPTLRGVHAPGEKLELASLDKFVKHLEDVIVSFR